MREKIFRVAILAALAAIIIIAPVSAASKTQYKNRLAQKEWTKYGVNPWRADTDNDGWPDEWEVKNGFCPTNAGANMKLADAKCLKGKINLLTKTYTPPAAIKDDYPRAVKSFTSCTDLRNQLSKLPLSGYYGYGIGMRGMSLNAPTAAPMSAESKASTPASGSDYSSTNVQVEGVDEGDIVKTDGQYIYNLSQGNLIISSAVPATAAKLLSKTKLAGIDTPSEIYISGDYLLVLGQAWSNTILGDSQRVVKPQIYPYYGNFTVAQIWKITDKTKPELVRRLQYSGNLLTSRLTNNFAYLVINSQPQYYPLGAKTLSWRADYLTPVYTDARGAALKSKTTPVLKQVTGCANVDYIYPIRRSDYLTVVALDMKNPMSDPGEEVIMGGGDKVYASTGFLYVAEANADYWWGAPRKEQTEIHKFKLDKKTITLSGSQTVPGTVLNQFSMDEKDGNLRLVTTLNGYWGEGQVWSKRNGLYVLDKDLNRIGWYDSFGEGEKIYSARFVGDRAYVVTFQETDPLFVFDLSDPHIPKLLGELKIPGYSTYLHPYDDTHLIGIGKNAVSNSSSPGFAWYQGLKIGLFDVSDPANPKELFKAEIGDRGTDSTALTDHHAFLFSKEKNLLAFPVSLAQLTPEQKANSANNPWEYGQINFQGLFVYSVDLTNGFRFIGPITHTSASTNKSYFNYYGAGAIKRSLYIGDNLYALSDLEMTAHKLGDLSQLSEVIYGTPDNTYPIMYEGGVMPSVMLK